MANDAITAHGGGELNDLKAPASERAALKSHAEKLPSVKLGARETADLEMLASGAFTPLTGFMGEADYLQQPRQHAPRIGRAVVDSDHARRR